MLYEISLKVIIAILFVDYFFITIQLVIMNFRIGLILYDYEMSLFFVITFDHYICKNINTFPLLPNIDTDYLNFIIWGFFNQFHQYIEAAFI